MVDVPFEYAKQHTVSICSFHHCQWTLTVPRIQVQQLGLESVINGRRKFTTNGGER
jgi:hypothetical protein